MSSGHFIYEICLMDGQVKQAMFFICIKWSRDQQHNVALHGGTFVSCYTLISYIAIVFGDGWFHCDINFLGGALYCSFFGEVIGTGLTSFCYHNKIHGEIIICQYIFDVNNRTIEEFPCVSYCLSTSMQTLSQL